MKSGIKWTYGVKKAENKIPLHLLYYTYIAH